MYNIHSIINFYKILELMKKVKLTKEKEIYGIIILNVFTGKSKEQEQRSS